jgi:HK97 family phage major capsid protein
MELQEIKDAIGVQWQQLRTELDKQHKDNDALREVKIDKLNDSITALSTKADALEAKLKTEALDREEVERKLNKLRLGSKADDGVDPVVETKSFNDYRRSFSNGRPVNDMTSEEYGQYKSAFIKVLRDGNERNLDDVERKALTAGTDSEGGYLLPATTVGRVVARIFELSPIRQIANVQPISTNAIEGVLDNDEAGYGWVSETGARTVTTSPALGKWRIEANEMYAAPIATQTLLDDAAVDVESWLGMKVADRFARVEGAAFINGTGVGQPRGFATYTNVATGDATRTWGSIEYIPTGASADFHTTQGDPLFTLIQAMKTGYTQNATWVTSREIVAKIRKFKTTTTLDYVWQPGLQMGTPDRLLGYPVFIAQDMPALAANSYSMAFGDFREAYTVVDRMGMRTLRDPYTNKPYVIFYCTARVGGGVLNFEAIKLIKFAAS